MDKGPESKALDTNQTQFDKEAFFLEINNKICSYVNGSCSFVEQKLKSTQSFTSDEKSEVLFKVFWHLLATINLR